MINDADDLCCYIIMALSDEAILSLPHDISVEMLFQKFPIIAHQCAQTLDSWRMSTAESDGNIV